MYSSDSWMGYILFPLTPALSPGRGRIVRRHSARPRWSLRSQCALSTRLRQISQFLHVNSRRCDALPFRRNGLQNNAGSDSLATIHTKPMPLSQFKASRPPTKDSWFAATHRSVVLAAGWLCVSVAAQQEEHAPKELPRVMITGTNYWEYQRSPSVNSTLSADQLELAAIYSTLDLRRAIPNLSQSHAGHRSFSDNRASVSRSKVAPARRPSTRSGIGLRCSARQ